MVYNPKDIINIINYYKKEFENIDNIINVLYNIQTIEINNKYIILKNVNQEKYIVLESYPGVMFNSTKQIQRIDLERKTYNKTVLLFVEGKGFTINMSVSTKSSLEINEGIFMSMINSIVFPDQYN